MTKTSQTVTSSKNKKIVFFGTEDFSLIALRELINAGYSIAAVVTKPDSSKGRSRTLTPPAVKVLAVQHGIPVWQPTKLADIADDIQKLNKPTGVLVSYGKIIPQSIIDLFEPGIINLHPSLLPEYRGPSPIESAIISGDKKTGVSIMQLSAAMDAGSVYAQTSIDLIGNETSEYLYEKLGKLGATMLIDILPAIIDGTLTPLPQDEPSATYCKLIQKSDGNIDWHDDSQLIEREVRAYHIWPKSRATVSGIDIIVTKAHAINDNSSKPGHVSIDSNSLIVGTGNGSISIDELKPAGKKEMPVSAFLLGYKSQL